MGIERTTSVLLRNKVPIVLRKLRTVSTSTSQIDMAVVQPQKFYYACTILRSVETRVSTMIGKTFVNNDKRRRKRLVFVHSASVQDAVVPAVILRQRKREKIPIDKLTCIVYVICGHGIPVKLLEEFRIG